MNDSTESLRQAVGVDQTDQLNDSTNNDAQINQNQSMQFIPQQVSDPFLMNSMDNFKAANAGIAKMNTFDADKSRVQKTNTNMLFGTQPTMDSRHSAAMAAG